MIDFSSLSIDLLLAAANVVLLVATIVLDRRGRYLGPLAVLLVALVLAASWWVDPNPPVLGAAFVADAWMVFLRRLLLAVALLTCLGSVSLVESRFPSRRGEYYCLLLLSLQGLLLMPGARDLLLLFVSFELASLPLYVLAAYDRETQTTSVEGGLKFYLTGAASSAIALFGMALVVGLAGSTRFVDLALVPKSPAFSLGILLMLAGMAYKLGLAPFHMWMPDTYQGASTPFVAYLAVAPKIAGLAAAINLFFTAFSKLEALWQPPIAAFAAISIAVGGVMALHQTEVKRLLAYSGVAHIGYALLGFAAGSELGLQMALFYFASYAATGVGVFLAFHAASGGGKEPVELDGLSRRSPALALMLLLFFLSLAGVPFVVGFWAKMYVLLAAYRAGLLWLVVLAATMTVVSLYYYLRVAGAMYLKESASPGPLVFDRSLGVAVLLCAFLVVAMGVWPELLLSRAGAAAAGFWEQRLFLH